MRWGFGVAAAQLTFADASTESALGFTVSARAWEWLDLPVTIGVSHRISGPWAPSMGFSLGVTLPTGDTTTVGSGTTALGASHNVGFSPSDHFSFGLGAARSLSDGYSAGLTTGSQTWAYSAGTGTTPSGIAAATAAPYQRIRQAFGVGGKLKAKNKTKAT